MASLTEIERANIYDWLKAHTEYIPNKNNGRYFWEWKTDNQLYAIYKKFLEEGYSRDGFVVHRKSGSRTEKSFVQLIMEYQEKNNEFIYTYEDMDKMTFERLRSLCYFYGLLPRERKKVTKVEEAPTATMDQAKEQYHQMTIEDLELASALYDEHEEFLTLDEVVDMYGIGITDEKVSTIEGNGPIKVIDAENGKLPYNARREQLKESLINFIIMNKVKNSKGYKYNRKQLSSLDINELQIIYEGFRSKLNNMQLSMFPSAEDLEKDTRFGR